jgi:hypothetical protein
MCRLKIILTHVPYLWRNGRNVEGSPWRLAFTGTPSGFLGAKTKLNTHAQAPDEECQDDQPECQGVEHDAKFVQSSSPLKDQDEP